MSSLIATLRPARIGQAARHWRRAIAASTFSAVALLTLAFSPARAPAADPAVVYMAQVGKELLAAAKTRSPGVMAAAVQRHGDVSYIGLFSLGNYRNQLPAAEKSTYYSGMVRFIGRYAAQEAPKYQIAKVEWQNESVKTANGIMVDSTVTLTNGSAYDVRWVLARQGSGFKVRDANVLGVSMTYLLKNLFEDYIAQNGGNTRALVAALNR